MNGILGSISIAQDTISCETERYDVENLKKVFLDRLQSIKECAEYQRVLLNSVLTLQKVESMNFKLDQKPFKLHEMLQSIVWMYKGMAQNKGIEIEMNASEKIKTTTFIGDEHQLKQVLINFLSSYFFFDDIQSFCSYIFKNSKCNQIHGFWQCVG